MSELVVEFCSLTTEGRGGAWAGGFVVIDVRSARAVHESARVLQASSEHEAAYRALLRALDLIEELSPSDVELRCNVQALVDQLTSGGAEADATIEPLFEEAMMRLLHLGLWRIRCVAAEELRRPVELAEELLGGGSGQHVAAAESEEIVTTSAEAAERQPAQSAAARVPRWTVEFREDAGPRCPLDCRAGQRFGFGPDTPAGFCVHAMAAVAEDGPLAWTDPAQHRMTTLCPHCDVPMDIEKLDD